MIKKSYPIVAIIGRINVGKSTLFNRLTEEKKALVSKIPGTTRDRNYGECFWRGRNFILIDTGGLVKVESQKLKVKNIISFKEKIQQQTKIAIKKADLILFVVDIQDGILSEDKQIANILRKSKKPVVLALNKADNIKLRNMANEPEFLKLGFGVPCPVSALNGIGTGDLLDEVVNKLRPQEKQMIGKQIDFPTKISIIGKPNVGKSSLLNAILGEERVIVSDIPFTTREPHDIFISYKNNPLLLVDTVGMRKKTKVKLFLEKEGFKYSLQSIKKSDIVILVIDISVKIGVQEKKLAGRLKDLEKGIIIVANKWDLIPSKNTMTIKVYTRYIQSCFPFLSWAPIIFVSAKTKQRVNKILDLILEIKKEREKNLEPKELDKFIRKLIKTQKPPTKILGLAQTGIKPPQFTLNIAKKKTLFPVFYLNIIEKKLREKFGFIGTPIKIIIKKHKI